MSELSFITCYHSETLNKKKDEDEINKEETQTDINQSHNFTKKGR